MKRLYIFIYIAIGALCLSSCAGEPKSDKPSMFVSIAPLRPLVTAIVGDDFDVQVLCPAGASPETFEPTPKQFAALGNARMVFGVGLLDFERALLGKVDDPTKVIHLAKGIEPIAGSCSHTHHGKCHHHGIDPHVWCSPKQLIVMAENAFTAINAAMPDSLHYAERYNALCGQLLDLDEEVSELCRYSPHAYFIIYHPALTYLARDYGLEQIAIEHEGKEPSVKRLGEIVDRARTDGTKRVFYQSEFPQSSVEVICEDIGAEAMEINPLDENIFDNLREIVRLVTE